MSPFFADLSILADSLCPQELCSHCAKPDWLILSFGLCFKNRCGTQVTLKPDVEIQRRKFHVTLGDCYCTVNSYTGMDKCFLIPSSEIVQLRRMIVFQFRGLDWSLKQIGSSHEIGAEAKSSLWTMKQLCGHPSHCGYSACIVSSVSSV